MVQKKVRTETAAVFVDASAGEFLRYQVSFLGGQAHFSIVDTVGHNILLSHKVGFVRDWPRPVDPVSQNTSHVATFHFALATQYTYQVELHRPNGTVRTLIDIDYSSNSSSDSEFQEIDVTTD